MKLATALIAITSIGVVTLITAGALAQHGGHARHDAQGHAAAQSCAEQFTAVVGEGRGFGMAFAADQNGYPGPMHVLELKERLKLTADQEAKARALHAAVKAELPKSARLLRAEARLEQLFKDGTASEAGVRAAVADVERARTDVRLVHLLTHLRTRDLLTDEQRRVYHEARWGRP